MPILLKNKIPLYRKVRILLRFPPKVVNPPGYQQMAINSTHIAPNIPSTIETEWPFSPINKKKYFQQIKNIFTFDYIF